MLKTRLLKLAGTCLLVLSLVWFQKASAQTRTDKARRQMPDKSVLLKRITPQVRNFATLDCSNSGTFYVNDNGQTGDVYTNAAGNDANCGTADAPFATIQHAIDVASANDIIYVDAGTYVENINVDKALRFRGANYLTNPNTGTRTAESIIEPATSFPDPSSPSETLIMYLTPDASGSTIDGFTFNGDNPNLTSGVGFNGADVDAAEGIVAWEGIANVQVSNNIIKNLNYAGVDFDNYYSNGAVTFGNLVTANKLDNMLPPVYGIGILIYDNAYTTISNNVMTGIRIGVQTGNFYSSDPGSSHTISGNTIQSARIGVWHNLAYQSASTFNINNNTITTYPDSPRNNGIEISSIQQTVGVNINNNNVTGAQHGINLWNCPTASTVTVNGGTLTNCGVGVFPNNWEGYSSDAATSTYIMNNVNIMGSTVAGIYVQDDNNNDNGATVSLQIQGTTSVNNTSTGLKIEGADASAVFSGTGVSFSGQAVYIDQVSNGTNVPGTDIDATGVSFNGKKGSAMNTTQAFNAENKINHKPDYSALGLVTFKASNVFLTANSFIPPFTTTASIQRGIDASSNGWTLNVGAGTFNENISVSKGLTIKGANYGVSCSSGRGAESLIAGALGNNSTTVSVAADNVTIDGFKITNTNGSYGIYALGRNNTSIQHNIITDIGNNTTGMGSSFGVVVEASTSANIATENVSLNCINNIRGGANTSLTGAAAKANNGSGGGIAVGFSTAANNITGLTISRNVIDHVMASTANFSDGGKGAYGVLVDVGASGSAAGKVVSPAIQNNDITFVEGLWAHGIGLEGETPNATVQNNYINNLTDHKGNTDAMGVLLEDNDGAGSVTIRRNSFTNMAYGIVNVMSAEVTGTCNWYGSNDSTTVASKIAGNVTYMPYLMTGTDTDPSAVGFQPENTCAQPILITLASQKNVSCKGGNNGSIDITVTGGSGNYTYAWTHTAQSTQDITDLTANTYTVTVTDGTYGITNSRSFIITEPAQVLAITVTNEKDAKCFGSSDGSISVVGSGGTSPYKFSFEGGDFKPKSTFAGLSAGTYHIVVKDNNACTAPSGPITVSQPQALTVSVSHQNVNCLHPEKGGSITATADHGTLPYQFQLSGPVSKKNTTGEFKKLPAGNYTVTVRDANGCTITSSTETIGGCSSIALENASEEDINANSLHAVLLPNPTTTEFTLRLSGKNDQKITINVLDISGKHIYQTSGYANQTYHFGQSFGQGVYVIQVIQNTSIQTIKAIKSK